MLNSLPRPRILNEKLEWPRRGTDVTIAAGFVCEEGILMCADTEYTSETDKSEGAKVFPRTVAGIELLFTGAGDRALIAMSTDMICDAIEEEEKAISGMNVSSRLDEVRKIIIRQVQVIHSQHLAYAAQPIPSAHLLIGAMSRDKDVADSRLLCVGNNTVERIMQYECVGAGASIGRWLSKIFYDRNTTMNLLKVAAIYIIQEAKANVPFCGGGTTIYTLRNVKRKVKRTTVWDDERISRDVQDAMRNALFLARDTRYDDDVFEEGLKAWMDKIRSIRAEINNPDHPPFDLMVDD